MTRLYFTCGVRIITQRAARLYMGLESKHLQQACSTSSVCSKDRLGVEAQRQNGHLEPPFLSCLSLHSV